MKKLFSFLGAIIISIMCSAQVIDTATLKPYPSSVIGKVYEVASRVTLSTTEQVLLAETFLDQEQQLSSLILSGAPITKIDSLKRTHTSEFNNLLGVQKIDDYYQAVVATKANAIARLTAQMLQSKYGTDSITKQYFKTIYEWREAIIEKLWLSSTDTAIRNNNLSSVIYAYDTLLTKYIAASASSNYFGTRLHYIDSIQSIPLVQKDSLAANYFRNCILYQNNSYSDNFNKAFNRVFNKITDTSYYLIAYSNEIVQNALSATQGAISGYVKAYQLSSYAAQKITPFVASRERAFSVINKLHPTYLD